jgi:hypothetical protein
MKRRIKRILLIIMFFGIANALLGYANNRQNILKIGDIAPNFLLPDQEGKLHRLSDYRGQRVVIYYFPKADTPG